MTNYTKLLRDIEGQVPIACPSVEREARPGHLYLLDKGYLGIGPLVMAYSEEGQFIGLDMLCDFAAAEAAVLAGEPCWHPSVRNTGLIDFECRLCGRSGFWGTLGRCWR